MDIVRVDPMRQKPVWALEVKWSDRACNSEADWAPIIDFAKRNGLDTVFMTSRTISRTREHTGIKRIVIPLAKLSYQIAQLSANQELLRGKYGLPEPRVDAMRTRAAR